MTTNNKHYCFGCLSSYALGLFFIFCVSLIWAAASILVQFLYTKESFDSPFLLTYIGVSLFTLLLPTKFALEQLNSLCSKYCCRLFGNRSLMELEIPAAASANDQLGRYENVPSVVDSGTLSLEEEEHRNSTAPMAEPYRDDAAPHHDEAENDEGPTGATNSVHDDDTAGIAIQPPSNQNWTNADHMKVAMKIAPVWFLANWTYNASLAYTSITSSTVLASTGSLFTFLFAVLSRDEQFTCLKLVGVLLGVTGSLFTALHDADNPTTTTMNESSDMQTDSMYNTTMSEDSMDDGEDRIPVIRCLSVARQLIAAYHHDGDWWSHERALFGDALGLISAVGYGAYAVMIRVQCPRDESLMSMELLLGYIGLFSMISLSPVLLYQLIQGNHSDLTWVVLGFLVIKGLLDNVLSDLLWARSVVLTSATVATVGLGLTIPLAFLSDVLWMGQDGDQIVSLSSVAGAASVLAGFVLVNIGADTSNVASEGDNTQTGDSPLDENDNNMHSHPPEPVEMKQYSDDEISQEQ